MSLNHFANKKFIENSSDPSGYHRIEKHLKKNLLSLVLFGSYARDQASQTSDKDLLIVLKKSIAIKRNLYQDWQIHLSLFFPKVSPHFVHWPHLDNIGSLWLEVSLEGQILFDRQNQLFVLLSEIRKQIAQLKYIRKQANGHPYWIKT